MIRTNIKRALFCSVIVVGAALMPTVSASAQEGDDVMYERYYYSDATHAGQVGYERDTCNYFGIGGGQTQGRETPYFDSYPIAICRNGQLYPY